MMYCCFLKQINFRNIYIKTIELKNAFETIPNIDNISIILTTGNVVFESNEYIKDLYISITQLLSQYFNYSFDIFIKSIDEIKKIIANNPFIENKENVIQTFITNDTTINKIYHKEFNNTQYIKTPSEKMKIINNQLYWQYNRCIKGYGNLNRYLSKKKYKHRFTLRTLGSLKKILKNNNK